MAWNDIIGQQRVKDLLRHLHESGRLPHAMLFFGPAGVGQDAMAIELAKALNCETGTFDACGTCASCRQMGTLQHQRLKLVYGLPSRQDEKTALDKMTEKELEEINEQIAAKAQNPYFTITIPKAAGIKISSIRDVLRESSLRASERGKTVVLVMDAEQLNKNAANALLKSLEEPTGDMLYILTTAKRDLLLPTIVSRCQQIRFDFLSEEMIMEGPRQRLDVDEQDAKVAAHLSGGSFGTALQLLEDDALRSREDLLAYMRALAKYNPNDLVPTLQKFTSELERSELIFFLASVQSWFRDIEAIRNGLADQIQNEGLREPLEKFAAHYTGAECKKAIEEVDFAIDKVYKNVHLMNILLVLSQRLRKCIVSNT